MGQILPSLKLRDTISYDVTYSFKTDKNAYLGWTVYLIIMNLFKTTRKFKKYFHKISRIDCSKLEQSESLRVVCNIFSKIIILF